VSTIGNIAGGIGVGVSAYLKATRPQLYSMTFIQPATGTTVNSSIITSGGSAPNPSGPANTGTQAQTITYFFDAVLAADHEHSSTLTKMPVQTGAPISLNIYRNAPRVVLEVIMSDAMASLVNGILTLVNQIRGNQSPSKSITAFQQWVALKNLGVPIVLATRLISYPNMAIVSIRARDEVKTAHGLRAVIAFEQIQMAQVAQVNTSARPDATDSTPQGTVNTETPAPQLVPSHTPTVFPTTPTPGAGTLSSNGTPMGGGSGGAF
jgi:hypothetical protein